jgi:putative ABC transport system permease protein
MLLSAVEGEASRRARELLSADVEISASKPFTAPELPGARSLSVIGLASMLQAKDVSFLVSVKAVPEAYPFYGSIETEPPGAKGVLLDESAALQRGLKAGDSVRLGRRTLVLAGLIKKEPDRLFSALGLAPRLLVPLEALEGTGLLGFGSRISYRKLYALPDSSPERAKAARESLENSLEDPALQVTAYPDADASVRETFERAALFFMLVSLVGLLLGVIGMASNAALFLDAQVPVIGLLRCLGVTARQVALTHFALLAAIGAAGGALGAAAGWVLARAGLGYARGWLGFALEVVPGWSWTVAAESAALCALASAAALGPRLLALSQVPPAGLKRPATSRAAGWTVAALGAAAIFAYAWKKTQSPDLARLFVLSLGGASAAAALLGRGVLALAERAAMRSRGALRLGLLELSRRPARTSVFLFLLTLGFGLLGGLRLVQASLSRQLSAAERSASPNLFLVDVQPSQAEGVRALIGPTLEMSPLIRARLATVKGKPAEEVATEKSLEGRQRQRFLTREYNLTYSGVLGAGQSLLEGTFPAEGLSLERSFAERLKLKLGDRLAFDVQGRIIEAPVTSIRAVDWMAMRPNFFVVLPPELLKGAPQILIGSFTAREPELYKRLHVELARRWPNISVIDAGQALERVQGLMRTLIRGLSALAWSCVALGLLVLGGTVLQSRAERAAQAGLLTALGAGRGLLRRAAAVEFGALGAASALMALLVSIGLAWAVTHRMRVELILDLGALILLGGGAFLPLLVGLASDVSKPEPLLRD